jgi:hypothetical protein
MDLKEIKLKISRPVVIQRRLNQSLSLVGERGSREIPLITE